MVDSEHPAYGHVSGTEVANYLEKVATQAGLVERTRFNTKVQSIRRSIGGGWFVHTNNGTLECDKLIVATGLYYVPNLPDIAMDKFKGPTLHSKTLARDHTLLTAPEVKDVLVVGGAKSAFEAAELCLKAGKRVHWVIRATGGNGPAMIVKRDHASFKGRLLLSAARTRLFSLLCPSIYNRTGFWYTLLHSGRFPRGVRWIKNLFSSSPNTFDYTVSNNAKALEPEINNMFWSTTSYAFLEDDSPIIRAIKSDDPNLRVYRGDLDRIEQNTVYLTNNTSIPADAIAFATGWKHAQSHLFTPEESLDLGLPTPLSHEPPSLRQHWDHLDTQADAEILSSFPLLASPPNHKTFPPHFTRHRMYHGIISPNLLSRNDRSIAFLGHTIVAHTPIHSHIGAIWAIAWLQNLMTIPKTQGELEQEVALANAFCERRYVAKGRHQPLVLFEAQGLFDGMVRDLGLRVERRGGGWREWVMPCVARDYLGLEAELVEKCRREDRKL